MDMIVFIVLTVIWLSVAAVVYALGRQRTWQLHSTDRKRQQLLRGLDGVRHALLVVYVLFSIVMIGQIFHAFTPYEVLPPLVWALLLAVAGLFLAQQPTVQERILGWIQSLSSKYSQLGVISSLFRAVEPLSRRCFPEYPYFRDKHELTQLVQHQHREHKVLSTIELRQVQRLLALEESTITSFIVPLKEAPMVKADDTIGPLLLSELHDSSYGSFAVYSKKRAKIVGVLDQGVAVSHASHGSKVAAIMEERLVHLPHDATYQTALQTFIETSSPLSVIIDGENQPVGVLYVQDILRDLFERSKEL